MAVLFERFLLDFRKMFFIFNIFRSELGKLYGNAMISGERGSEFHFMLAKLELMRYNH